MPNRHSRRKTLSLKMREKPLVSRVIHRDLLNVHIEPNGTVAQHKIDDMIDRARAPFTPVNETIVDPYTGTEISFHTSKDGVITYLNKVRKSLIQSGLGVLSHQYAQIDGLNTHQMLLMGVIDTIICSIDYTCTLIKGNNWYAIPQVARTMLDSYLIYDGIVHSTDPLGYIKDIRDGFDIHDHKSVAGHDMSYTHLAELASAKYPPMSELFSWHSTQHHFSIESLTRLSWRSGTTPKAGDSGFDLAIGSSEGPFDQMALAICTRVFQILEYSSFIGKPLDDTQIAKANALAVARKAEKKQHKADIKEARSKR